MRDGKFVILCVDDDADILETLSIVLEAEGYRFVGASSGEEALRIFATEPPDLFLVDLMMEEVDAGTVLAKELQRLGNTAPVYLLSSVGDNLDLTVDSSTVGLSGVFQKPLSARHLLAMLRARLGDPIEAGA